MTQEHEKRKTGKQREGLWQRVPKSALLNFGALFIMFLVVFILHRYGDRIIKEESKDQVASEISAVAPQQETPKAEETPQVDAAKQEAKQPEPVTVRQEKPVKIISLPERETDVIPKQAFRNIPRAVEAEVSVEELDSAEARQYYLSKTGKYVYTSNQNLRAQEQAPSQKSFAPGPSEHSADDEYIPFERSGK